jgi:hypothetical protein
MDDIIASEAKQSPALDLSATMEIASLLAMTVEIDERCEA